MSYKRNAKILLASGGVPVSETAWKFYTQDGIKTIHGHNDNLTSLLPLCDGTNTIMQIQNTLSHFPSVELERLISDLMKDRILVDCDKLYDGFIHFLSSGSVYKKRNMQEDLDKAYNTPSLPSAQGKIIRADKVKLSNLSALLATRKTVYKYGARSLSFSQISELFWSVYGIQGQIDARLSTKNYTVPSGGAFYALRFDMFLLKDVEEMVAGHYLWRPEQASFEYIKTDVKDIEGKIFDSKTNTKNATGILIVSANLEKTSQKYGAAALPLSYIEAGHACQNAYLYSSQENISVAEIYGFNRNIIENIINKDGFTFNALTSMIFGTRE